MKTTENQALLILIATQCFIAADRAPHQVRKKLADRGLALLAEAEAEPTFSDFRDHELPPITQRRPSLADLASDVHARFEDEETIEIDEPSSLPPRDAIAPAPIELLTETHAPTT